MLAFFALKVKREELTVTCTALTKTVHRTVDFHPIMLTLISDKVKRQETLFDGPLKRAQSAMLMAVMDAINAEFGRDTVRTGAIGTDKRRAMRSENRSPRFTTRRDELPVAQ